CATDSLGRGIDYW
nr:immunoglobulin heavy chain junction region [Macaca mulatta]MOW46045.1 immunoglobulin heavy chain junction region [Macaca mulatta]MOW46427.1 immunoglobulin heavy chain junction region [Macaca mulatta]MOW46765.1 immunoglobulin heavy chain junction region [Macaca mulatta]MOW46991.1 immunoglobulin heavy chain junction region [Macaca mulatta]